MQLSHRDGQCGVYDAEAEAEREPSGCGEIVQEIIAGEQAIVVEGVINLKAEEDLGETECEKRKQRALVI